MVTMSADQEKKAIRGIQIFKYAATNGGYVTSAKMIEGFVRSGQHIPENKTVHCPILGFENSTVSDPNFLFFYFMILIHSVKQVDFESIIRKCITDIPPADYDNIIRNAPEMIEEARTIGRVSEETMDRLNIIKLGEDEYIRRDELGLTRQGALLVNCDDSIERERAYQNRHNEPTAAVQLQTAQKLVEAAEKAARKKAANEEKKAAEKTRRSLLTGEERKAESDAKKATLAQRKAATLAKLHAAEQLVAANI